LEWERNWLWGSLGNSKLYSYIFNIIINNKKKLFNKYIYKDIDIYILLVSYFIFN